MTIIANSRIYLDRGTIDYRTNSQHRVVVLRIITRLRSTGSSFEEISRALNRTNTRTLSGKGNWHRKTVNRLYNNL